MIEESKNVLDLEKIFDNYLLRDIEIIHDDKVVRSGKLKMVTVKHYNIKLYFEANNTLKTVDLTYPFVYKEDDKQIVFDYSEEHISKNSLLLKVLIDNYPSEERSRFYNSIVYIRQK